MSPSRSYSVCALFLTLTFLLGTLPGGIPVPSAAHCRQCPPGCPMHSGKLGCHHGGHAAPHQRDEPGLRCACGSHPEASIVPLPAVRALLVARSESWPIFMASSLTPSIPTFSTQCVLEPPTDPPRASVV